MESTKYKIAKYIVVSMTIIQLALSQIHISAITKVFVLEVGFFLFLFIIFGLLITFNLLSKNNESSKFLFQTTGSIFIACATGIYYMYLMYNDYINNELVTIDQIQLSLIIVGSGIGTYILGWVYMLIKEVRGE
ncbi:hypothetical protein QBE53_15495 [Vallitaleaceae bacterium 9-2]